MPVTHLDLILRSDAEPKEVESWRLRRTLETEKTEKTEKTLSTLRYVENADDSMKLTNHVDKRHPEGEIVYNC